MTYREVKKGEKLTRRGAVLANCYICNGLEDSRANCQGKSCPLYPYRPYKSKLRAVDGSSITPQYKETEAANV